MNVILKNCDVNLKTNLGINMQTIGAYDRLVIELNNHIQCYSIEYDYLIDSIKFEINDGIQIPDLSPFGEVQPNDNPIG